MKLKELNKVKSILKNNWKKQDRLVTKSKQIMKLNKLNNKEMKLYQMD